MIDPNAVTTVRVGELPPADFILTDNVPHEIGTELYRGTVQQLADLIGSYLGTSDSLAFNPTTVNDGGTLPSTDSNEWMLVGKGTFHNVGGGSDIITTEELNAVTSNGSYWSLAVQIPINVELAGITQNIRSGYTQTAPSEDAVFNRFAEIIALIPGTQTTDTVVNVSGVPGANASDALDNLSTTISTGTILNQNTVLQTANFRISGTDSYFGTSKFSKSATSSFPAINKTPSGSINIETVNNDDINLAPNGTGQVNITNGWGLGFKPVAGLSAGPDFGTTMGGMSYRPPTESMTKNFLIFRFGQYVFEDDTATWKMILTPTGVNIGGGATGVGGAIPLNAFEVHGNSVIGGGYDRVRTAPANGLLVEGNTGIGTYTPIGRLNVLTGSGLTKDVVNLENGSISFSNGSAGVTVPDISSKSTNGIGLSITGVNIDANPNADMVFNTTRVDGLDYTDLTKSAFRFRRAGSTTVNLIDILRNGNTSFTGSITAPSATITTAPTTSAATYDILTRNTSTGVVEKIVSSALPTSGTYTPVISSQINTSSAVVTNASYYRVGSVVTVTLYGTLNLTSANTYSSFTISLPINRATSSSYPMGLSMLRNTNVFCNGWVTSSLTSETTIVFNLTPSTGGSTFTANFTYNVNI